MKAYAGEFTVSTTGNKTITVGGSAQIEQVIFFVANVNGNATGVNLGVSFGIAFRDEAALSTLRNQCWFEMPNFTGGNRMRLTKKCFWTAATPAGGVTLDATIVSFGNGQFTINVGTCAASRVVRYLAISLEDEIPDGFGHAGGHAGPLPTSLDIGFRARSGIGLHGWCSGGLDGEFDTDYAIGAGNAPKGAIFVGVGASSFPVGGGGNLGAGVTQSYQYQHRLNTWASSLAVPNFFRADSIGVIINTIVGGTKDAAPSSPTALTMPSSAPADVYTAGTWWDAESSLALFTTPSTVGGLSGLLDTGIHNPNLTDIAAVFWMAGHPTTGALPNGRVPAVGFGVWTKDYEGCVFVDGGGGRQALFQSSTESWCHQVDATSRRAGITHVIDKQKVQIETTQIGGPGGTAQIVMFALGNQKVPMWIPQMSRYSM